MKPNDLPTPSTAATPWTLARRAARMNPSVIREILKVTEKPGIISFAGGLPSPKTFPVTEFAAACAKVLAQDGQAALQYAASEGYAPLREAVAAQLPWAVDPAQVLITTGSQQGLDLVAKVLVDSGSRVLVETPTYLGALQAFTPMEPEIRSVASDAEGIDVDDLERQVGSGADRARFLYVLPNFQNPTGRSMSEARRAALVARAAALGLPIVEDNPYGDLWFDAPPPLPLAARHPEGCIYLGSFSKVLAPGLRLGFVVVPPALVEAFAMARAITDRHAPGDAQAVLARFIAEGHLLRHLRQMRELYLQRQHTLRTALAEASNGAWQLAASDRGMHLLHEVAPGTDDETLSRQALAAGVMLAPLSRYAMQSARRGWLLGYAGFDEAEIRAAARVVGGLVRQR